MQLFLVYLDDIVCTLKLWCKFGNRVVKRCRNLVYPRRVGERDDAFRLGHLGLRQQVVATLKVGEVGEEHVRVLGLVLRGEVVSGCKRSSYVALFRDVGDLLSNDTSTDLVDRNVELRCKLGDVFLSVQDDGTFDSGKLVALRDV